MQLRTILLVACLTTVPVVAADGPVPGCEETDYGLRCEGSLPPMEPVNEGPGAQEDGPCPPVTYTIQTDILPVEAHVDVRCIIQI